MGNTKVIATRSRKTHVNIATADMLKGMALPFFMFMNLESL